MVDPARYARYGFAVAQPEYMWEGEQKYFSCTGRDRYIYVQCANRRIYLGLCKYLSLYILTLSVSIFL